MQARIDVNGILQLEVENTTEYWAIQEWLKQRTFSLTLASVPKEVSSWIPAEVIELNWQKIATKSNPCQ